MTNLQKNNFISLPPGLQYFDNFICNKKEINSNFIAFGVAFVSIESKYHPNFLSTSFCLMICRHEYSRKNNFTLILKQF